MKHRVDEQGFLIDSYLNDYPHFQEGWILIETPISESFIKTKWNGSQWVEGATPEEILETNTLKKSEAKLFIQTKYVDLLKSALERATGKKGSLEYLKEQRFEYENKYKCALEVLSNQNPSNQFIVNTLIEEKEYEDFAGNNLNLALQSFGLTSLNDRLKDYCQIIRFQFEYSNPIYLEMEAMIIYFRTRMVTDIEFDLWEKYNQRLDLVKTIVPETTISEMRTMYNQCKAI